MGVLSGAVSVLRIALAVAAALIVLWVLGVATTPGATGLVAVGAGIHAVLSGFTQIVRGL
jgi:hypothetical protein